MTMFNYRMLQYLRRLLPPAACVVGSLLIAQAATAQSLGDIFVIDMENHNFTQPSSLTAPAALLNNPAAPFLNSLMTPGNPNAALTSWTSNYHNVAPGIHPSEPNYIWQEGGSNFGVANDNDPYANNGANVQTAPNLSGLLQNAGIPWKSYQEDIDVNFNTGAVLPQSQWTVPLTSASGTSAGYTNAYNGSNQYNFATKHDGQLFYSATNGGNNTTPSNPEASYYAPLQQLATDLNNNTVAKYNLITPDQYNDMHSSLNTNFTYNGTTYTHNTDTEAIALGDNFLSTVVPQIEASQAFKNNGMIDIWFDETEGGDSSSYTLPDIVISPLAKGNAYDSILNYTHSSDLKTLQEVFRVSAPGGGYLGDANTPGTNDFSDLFKPGVVPAGLPPANVPEAGTPALFATGLGLLGLMLTARRKARKA